MKDRPKTGPMYYCTAPVPHSPGRYQVQSTSLPSNDMDGTLTWPARERMNVNQRRHRFARHRALFYGAFLAVDGNHRYRQYRRLFWKSTERRKSAVAGLGVVC